MTCSDCNPFDSELVGMAALEYMLRTCELRKESRKTYMRKYMNSYYSAHRDVILQQQVEQKKRYRETHREQIISKQKEWYLKNKAKKEKALESVNSPAF